MIEEGRALEDSGRSYALVRSGGWMKLFLPSSVFMPGGLLAVVVLAAKLALCGLAIVVIDSSFAEPRFFRIAGFLGAAFLLALVDVALALGQDVVAKTRRKESSP